MNQESQQDNIGLGIANKQHLWH